MGGSYCIWQAALAEEAFERRGGEVLAGGLRGLAQQQVARGMIGDGEGITIASIAELEFALEVGTPEFVGVCSARQRRSHGAAARATWRDDEPVPMQHGVDGALGGGTYVAGQSRTNSSRIFRAPQCCFSRLMATMRASSWAGN